GFSTLNFAQEFLFGPLGISDVEWEQDPQGLYLGGHGLYLRPRDMAKFGYLYLHNGMWDDEQIIPAVWVDKSTETLILRGEYGYGYQWWTDPSHEIYFASGLYGQKIIVVPDYDIVIVFTATIKRGSNPEFELLFDFIIPAVIGDTNITLVEFDNLSLSVVIAFVVSYVLVVPAVLIVKKRRF
ncbi:MAG: serine hydrolase domain-containing protein, partial [Candidatus Heimdallarchaeota archaeon]